MPPLGFASRPSSSEGKWAAPAIPSVLGTGPLYSQTPGPIDSATDLPTPKYSGYWRVYNVIVPASGRVFAPAGSDADMALTAAGVNVQATTIQGPEAADPTNAAKVAALVGRVALDPATCFASLAAAAARFTCPYLESQAKIESLIDKSAIVRTDVTVTCPIVSIEGIPVQP